MADYSDAVIIVAALIQSGQFKLVDSDTAGQPIIAERLPLADVIDASEWRTVPALIALRKLTDVICRALSEPMRPPTVGGPPAGQLREDEHRLAGLPSLVCELEEFNPERASRHAGVARPTPNGPMSARRPWCLSLAAPIGSLKPEVIDLPSPSIDAIRSVRAFWPPSAIRSTDGYDGGRRKRSPRGAARRAVAGDYTMGIGRPS
jgi:hypothetical protein